MVAYSFKPYFVPQIAAGIKLQTIRNDRPRHARPGEMVQLYQGMRTRNCRKIVSDRECLSADPVEIHLSDLIDTPIATIIVAGQLLDRDEIEQFARADGFAPEHINQLAHMDGKTARENMGRFWRENHPGRNRFTGVLIRWSPGD